MVKITIQESAKSQFKNSENHHSRIVKSDIPEYPKSQSNNTEYSDIEHNENQSCLRTYYGAFTVL